MSLKTYKILAIDTSTDRCSVALQVDKVVVERCESKPREHARLVLPMIQNLLEETGVSLHDLDAFACTRGPGSFTGIRIGTSVTQGLSFGLNKPVILISTLRALAQTAYRTEGIPQVFARLEARLEEIYWGLFSVDDQGIMQPQSNEYLQDPKQVILPEGFSNTQQRSPFAQDLLRIAQSEFELGHLVSALDVQPVYLKNIH